MKQSKWTLFLLVEFKLYFIELSFRVAPTKNIILWLFFFFLRNLNEQCVVFLKSGQLTEFILETPHLANLTLINFYLFRAPSPFFALAAVWAGWQVSRKPQVSVDWDYALLFSHWHSCACFLVICRWTLWETSFTGKV